MVLTFDVGSSPFQGDFEKFLKGSQVHPFLSLLNYSDSSSDRRFFEDKVVSSFIDKVKTGISVPNYPQFRDMNEMFLNSIRGLVKTADGFKIADRLSISEEKLIIPEVITIVERAREIYDQVGASFKLKLCITGPYTLSSLFTSRESHLFTELSEIICKFVDKNVFREKFGEVSLISIDEPVFGLFDDSLLDFGQGGREELLKSWEVIFSKIRAKNVKSVIHLHSTSDKLFWNVKSLDIVESHVDDPIYSSTTTKELLEKTDKFLKASICITNFDSLIRNKEAILGVKDETELSQRTANAWTRIRKGEDDPVVYLESRDLILNRLNHLVHQYGDRASYAGPECGLKSFPTYDSALECLSRVAEASQELIF